MTKVAVGLVFCAFCLAFAGCVSVGANVSTIGPDIEFSESDRRMAGKVTLVELDADGFELSRTDDPSAVFVRLGMSKSAIAAASGDSAEDPIPALDYMNFKEGDEYAKAQYPGGHSGHRRLEFEFPSPSQRCASMNYTLLVEWSWRRDRVERSRVSGWWNDPVPDPCIQGELRANNIGPVQASERGPGSDQYSISIVFAPPLEDLEKGEIVKPASTEEIHHFGGGNVSVRGDGTARFSVAYGLAGK